MSNLDDTMRDPIQSTSTANNASQNAYTNPNIPPRPTTSARRKSGTGDAARWATSAVFGVILGVGGAMAYDAVRKAPEISAEDVDIDESASGNKAQEVDDLNEIHHASTPTDDMSFNQAFAAARQEVGPNGVFEWRDGVYHTYYAEEWNSFSDEYKQNISSHNWKGNNTETAAASPEATESPEVSDSQTEDPAAKTTETEQPSLTYLYDESGKPYLELTDAITGAKSNYYLDEKSFVCVDSHGELIGIADETNIDTEAPNCLIEFDDEGSFMGYTPLEQPLDSLDVDELADLLRSMSQQEHISTTNIIDDNSVMVLNETQYTEHHTSVAQTSIIDDNDPVIIESTIINQELDSSSVIDSDNDNFIEINDPIIYDEDNNFTNAVFTPEQSDDDVFTPIDLSEPVPFPEANPVIENDTPHLVHTDFPDPQPYSPTIDLNPDPIYSATGSAYQPIDIQPEFTPVAIDPTNPVPFPDPVQEPDNNGNFIQAVNFPYEDVDDNMDDFNMI